MSHSDSNRKNLYQRINKWLVDRFESSDSVTATRRQFQPAAVELEATPPNPLARAVSQAVILLFVIAVVWACIGKVDVVAVATGQIIPSERVKDIQPLILGQVAAIYVREGQQVTAGDLLVELDPTIAKADLAEVESELLSLSQQRLRAEHLQNYLGQESSDLDKTLVAYEEDQHDQMLVQEPQGSWALRQEIERYRTNAESLKLQIQAREAEARMAAATVDGLEQTLPIVEERLEAMESLAAQNLVSRSTYLELKQEHIQQQQALASSRENQAQLLNEAADLQARLQNLKSTRLTELATEQENLTRQINSLRQELARARERSDQLRLRAPISGSVQNVAVHTLGGVVQPAQVLMQIVPEQAKLEVEAWVENRDIGFVEEGQVAEVKVDTFQFTRYGFIDGRIEMLSEDAVNDEQRGPIYRAQVSLGRDWMQVENKQVRLSPGMSVSVEVKTDQRRLIEYFLSPLLRYTQESVRER